MKNACYYLFIIVLMMTLYSGCNIFNWTSSSEEDAYYDGLKLFNDGKFADARAKFEEAIQSDPWRSDYRYYHAKALVMESDLNFFKIAHDMVDANNSNADQFQMPLYTWDKTKYPNRADELAFKNRLYNTTWRCHDDLSPIFFGRTHGEVTAEDIYFEYSIISMSRAVLQLRDTNNDSTIDAADWYFTIKKVVNPQTGEEMYVPDLQALINDLKNSPDARAGFNRMLLNTVKYGADGIVALVNTFSDSTVIDPQELQSVLNRVEELGNLYQIGDGIDNDQDGRVDEELINLIDDDGDGRIDEDARLN